MLITKPRMGEESRAERRRSQEKGEKGGRGRRVSSVLPTVFLSSSGCPGVPSYLEG